MKIALYQLNQKKNHMEFIFDLLRRESPNLFYAVEQTIGSQSALDLKLKAVQTVRKCEDYRTY